MSARKTARRRGRIQAGVRPGPAVPLRAPGGARLDLAIVALIVLAWVVLSWLVSRGERVFAYDTFRDLAYAENILRGRIWADPTLPGLTWWYAPGNPMLIAAAAAITRRTVADLYGYSLFWLNWLNPVLLYLLVRSAWNRTTGLVALPIVWLGSYWWLTHAIVPMPSIQGLALNLAGLLAWHRSAGSRWRWPLLTGLLAALSLWHHPLCGTVLLAAILGHAALAAVLRRGEGATRGPDRFLLLRRAAVVAGTALVLAGPLLVHLVRLERHNLEPYHWFAPELHDPRFAAHLHAPLVVPLGLVGIWLVLRTMPAAAWVVVYFAVGLAGQAVGYAAHDWGWPIPYLIPHEFQWHGQLAFTICAAVAAVWLAERAASRVRRAASRSAARVAVLLGLVLLAVGPAIPRIGAAGSQLIRFDERWAQTLELSAWVREHTPFDATFACPPALGYFLASLTGRKCLALPPGHMNPAADAEARIADLRTMLTTAGQDTFVALARRYRATYLLTVPAPGSSAATQAFYADWKCLEPANLSDSTTLIYRIRVDGGR
jgi:hypothetical protein